MFRWIFGRLFKKSSKTTNAQPPPKKTQTLPMAWSEEKKVSNYGEEGVHNDNNNNINNQHAAVTPVARVERILNFADDFVESVTKPRSSSPNSIETPHSGKSENNSLDGGNSEVWDVSVAICDGAEESDDDDIKEVEEKQAESQLSGHFAAIRADALGIHGLSNSFRKPSLPPLSLTTQRSSNQEDDMLKNTSNIDNNEPLNERSKEVDNEVGGVVIATTVQEAHYQASELKKEQVEHVPLMQKTAIDLFHELGERPEDSESEDENYISRSEEEEEEKESKEVQNMVPIKSVALPPLLPSLSMNSSTESLSQMIQQQRLKPLSSSLSSLPSLKSLNTSMEKPKLIDPLNSSFSKSLNFKSPFKSGQKKNAKRNKSQSIEDIEASMEETPIDMITSPLSLNRNDDGDQDGSESDGSSSSGGRTVDSTKKTKSSSKKRSKSRSISRSRSRSRSTSRAVSRDHLKRHPGASPINKWEIELEDFPEDFDVVDKRRAIQL
jgi:hypothetical protein